MTDSVLLKEAVPMGVVPVLALHPPDVSRTRFLCGCGSKTVLDMKNVRTIRQHENSARHRVWLGRSAHGPYPTGRLIY